MIDQSGQIRTPLSYSFRHTLKSALNLVVALENIFHR